MVRILMFTLFLTGCGISVPPEVVSRMVNFCDDKGGVNFVEIYKDSLVFNCKDRGHTVKYNGIDKVFKYHLLEEDAL